MSEATNMSYSTMNWLYDETRWTYFKYKQINNFINTRAKVLYLVIDCESLVEYHII